MRQQVPQARLVARRWLVHSAQELEGQHRCCHGCHAWTHSHDVERQRGEGAQVQDARGTYWRGLKRFGDWKLVIRVLLTYFATARQVRTLEILVKADH
jgi:hypothetical protein